MTYSITMKTGYNKLDGMINELGNAKLFIIAGRPTLGKTTLALSIAKNVAVDQGVPTLFFSLEESKHLLMSKLVSNLHELEFEKIMHKTYNKKEREIYETGVCQIKNSPLHIDDTSSLSISEFISKVRQMVSTYGTKLVIVDYLQLMEHEGGSYYNKELTAIAHSMREVAIDLNITIIVCAMLPIKGACGKRPSLSMLKKYYVDIDKEADIIACIHRPVFYRIVKPDDDMEYGIAEIILAKNAFGIESNFMLQIRPQFSKFYDY